MKSLFSKQLTKKIGVSLDGENVAAGSPLFAINWFDTRLSILYHFYNSMAASRVFRIGGKVFMKAKVGEQLAGDSAMKREFLLIVNYPSPEAFLSLVGDPIFQIISLMRTAAVKRFSFCLNKRYEEPQLLETRFQEHDQTQKYAVLIFKGEFAEGLRALAKDHSIEVRFSSERALTVAVIKGEVVEHNAAITEKVFLLSADDETSLEAFFSDPKFVEASSTWSDSFAAHLEPILS